MIYVNSLSVSTSINPYSNNTSWINTIYFNPKKISPTKIDKFCKEYKIDRNKFVILLPGRLTYWKGQKIFIEAIKLLGEKNISQPFEGIIIGGDKERSVYKKQLVGLVEQYRLNKIIKFIDYVDEMPIAYSIANIVCSCSYEPESFGRTSVEAQAMEIPVVASDIGGSVETIVRDKTGLLFKNKDANDLAESIKKLVSMEHNTLKSMGLEGRKNVIKKFDVNKMCYTTFTEYKKLIKSV